MASCSLLLRRGVSTSAILLRRPHLTRPFHPSRERRLLLSLSEPEYPEKHVDTSELWRDCPRHEELEEKENDLRTPNAFEMLFVEELKEWLGKSKMVGIIHVNSMKVNPLREAWQNARRCGLELKQYEIRMALAALEGTKWEPLLHFWHTAPAGNLPYKNLGLLFSEEVNPSALMQYDKKCPDIIILGALLEDRVVTKQTLRELAELPSLEVLRANLVALLDSNARQTLSILNRNQQSLSANLDQFVKDKQKDA